MNITQYNLTSNIVQLKVVANKKDEATTVF